MSKNEDPPLMNPDKIMFWFIVVSILTFVILIWGISQTKVEFEKADLSSTEYFLKAENEYEINLSFVVGGIQAQAPPYIIDGEILGTLVEEYQTEENNKELMNKIIWCESKGDPTAKNPESTAYGICQFINGTWEYVQEKWDIKLDRDNYYDQYYACERLLREEGTKHWKESKGCWKK